MLDAGRWYVGESELTEWEDKAMGGDYDPFADGWDYVNGFLMRLGLPNDSAQAIVIILALLGMYGVFSLPMLVTNS